MSRGTHNRLTFTSNSITRGSTVFRIKPYIFAEKFCQEQFENYFERKVLPGACKVNPLLRNVGHNNISTRSISDCCKKCIGQWFCKYWIL